MQDRSRGKLSFLAATLLTGAVVAACSSDTTEPPPGNNEDNLILMQASSFAPDELTIDVGETVTWRNAQAIAHTITSDDGEWSRQVSENEAGWEFEHTFDTAGSFDYECEFHPGMVGTIVVE